MSKNKVKFGLENVHVAKINEEAGEITYGTPTPIKGAVSLTADAEGESTPFYADNIKYYIAVSNQGYTGELTLAMTPDEFLKDIMGQEQDDNGALIENANDINARFALMGEIKGDIRNRRFVYYDCTAARPSQSYNTIEESKTPETDSISLTMSPRNSDNAIKAVIELNDNNGEAYNNFFKSVYEKKAVVGV